jgi:hypothetical protein
VVESQCSGSAELEGDGSGARALPRSSGCCCLAEANRMADEFRRRRKAFAMPNGKPPRGWAANPNWWKDLPL